MSGIGGVEVDPDDEPFTGDCETGAVAIRTVPTVKKSMANIMTYATLIFLRRKPTERAAQVPVMATGNVWAHAESAE